jgi:hypothetical protein
LLLFGLIWGNYRFAEKAISGEGFQIQWIGIRAIVSEGQSPYSESVSSRIQEKIQTYQGFLQQDNPSYTSPFYSALIVLPFAFFENNTLAHALWSTAQLVAFFAIIMIGLKITSWKPPSVVFFVITIFTLFSYHVVIPWLDGSLAIWASLFIVLSLLAIRNNWNEAAGILLALSTIQPLLTILIVVFILIWAASMRKRSLFVWFFMTLFILSIIGLFLVPDWIMQYLRVIYNFSSNFSAGSPAILFQKLWPGLGKQLGWFFTGLSAIFLLIEWWMARRKEYRWFLWTACLTIVLSVWIGIPTDPGNYILLLVPLILVLAMLAERWPHGGQWAAVLIVLVLFIWEWALYYRVLTSSTPTEQVNLLVPLPLILFIGLYWVRWWAIKPKYFLIEELRLGEA